MARLLIGRRRRDREEGVSLVTAMVITLAVFSIGGVWVGVATHEFTQSDRDRRREQARNAAEAGINRAMSGLSVDAAYPGSTLAALPGGAGEYEVAVSTVTLDPADNRRRIVATGYAPSRNAPRRLARRLEQQVDIIGTGGGFRYALFAASGITGANHMTVNGDVFANDDFVLANNTTVAGGITAVGRVTTANNSTVAGDIRAGEGVVLDNSSTTVLGSVYSGGNVALTGRVRGDVQAAGSITGGTVDGNRAQFSPPTTPLPQNLPGFTWNPANYPSVNEWAQPALFQAYWQARTGAFSGHHRIACSPCVGSISLGSKWTLAGDTTIVTNSPITLSRDVANGAGGPVNLTIVSFAATSPAILLTDNMTLPDDITVALFAPNGSAEFRNQKAFTGSVYASAISLAQQFTLTFRPFTVPGFIWDGASSTHFIIQARTFREVPAL